jgi:glucosamine-6-phosphate deaminase
MTDTINPVRQARYDWGKLEIYGDKVTLGQAAAALVAGCLRDAIAKGGHAAMILATGASQYEYLDALRKMKGVDWQRVTAFHLDEYLGMSDQHPASFRRYLRERVFDHLPFGAIHLLDGDATDAAAECQRYSRLLAAQPIDVACIGIGENGHLAFNDPPADFDTPALVHVVTLDEACRRQQVGEGHFATFADVPTHALSLTIPAILRANAISCVVPDLRKASAVRCSVEGPVTPNCPASALQKHANVRLYLDQDSASLLG